MKSFTAQAVLFPDCQKLTYVKQQNVALPLGSLPEVSRRPPQLGATFFPLGHSVQALWLRGCGRLVLGVGLGVSLGAWFADGILVGLDWAQEPSVPDY